MDDTQYCDFWIVSRMSRDHYRCNEEEERKMERKKRVEQGESDRSSRSFHVEAG